MRGALFILMLSAGCTKQLADLTPFPCPTNGVCPGGLACIPGVGCAPARLDAPCIPGGDTGTDCSVAGPGPITCFHRVCEAACGAGGSCPSGRICAGNACLVDCTADGNCPAGLACHPFGDGNKSACMPAGIFIPACELFDPAPSVANCFACGMSDFTVKCTNGHTCATNSHCNPDGTTCTCDAGYSDFTCDGTSCATITCAYPGWHCVTDTLPGTECTDATLGSGTCQCRDGRKIPKTCTTSTCEQICTPAD